MFQASRRLRLEDNTPEQARESKHALNTQLTSRIASRSALGSIAEILRDCGIDCLAVCRLRLRLRLWFDISGEDPHFEVPCV